MKPTNGEVWLIYQDCAMCGSRENWGKAQTTLADTFGLKIVKVGFTDPRAEGHMWEAVKVGIQSYPFFWDGKKYAQNISAYAPKPKAEKKMKKKTKRERKMEIIAPRKDEVDGSDSEPTRPIDASE